MSHFTVLVIGENPEDQLAPYHEFECTGKDDKYVQDIDITIEARQEYDTATTTRYKDPQGNLHAPWGDEFYREPTPEEAKRVGMGTGCGGGISWSSRDWQDGKGYRPKVHFLPPGWQQVEVPKKEIQSFLDYCRDYHGKSPITKGGLHFERAENDGGLSKTYKYGYTLKDEVSGEVIKVIKRTNPNRKWDWYQLGGRWRGFFKLKAGLVKLVAAVGEPGLMTASAEKGYADAARRKNILILNLCATRPQK